MSPRSIVLLGVTTLMAIVAALLLTGERNDPQAERAGRLVPELRPVVNEIDAIDIVAAGETVVARLRRDQERWRVENRDGYDADFRRVHDLLRELAEASRAEPRTTLEEWYPRLGLSGVESEAARGLRVSFPGRDLPAVILGDRDETTGGRYARLVGQGQSWLTDQPLALPPTAIGWLERSVMDIPGTELAEVTIVHPDGDRVRLRPGSEEGDQWVLLDVPEGREARPAWEIRPVANGLANITLEDVRRHEAVPDDAIRALYVTRDGLNFVVDLFVDEDVAWAHFTVSAEPEAVPVGEETGNQERDRLLADAAAVDARLSPWQFALPTAKFETMTRRLEDLLADPAAD
ncbi:DUF4340 domain-containing protein [Wenzhouxiangella limi]|uniref:DUF4340 domain-containing protein n=1 Tax=Wenzhouxiangella limi TaxID=2707351 RepID=A0A845UW99_9GAMM|nr:DUF4340 domain-containing protein [Wenzhouxiangella limi]NDY94532.1 DUF4340 domain-containing protein [Wenzhouxiangella limi]